MAYPSRGERVVREYHVPVELDDWLAATARPHGDETVCPVGRTKNDLVVAARYLLREVRDGVPSPVSTALLDEAVARLDAGARA